MNPHPLVLALWDLAAHPGTPEEELEPITAWAKESARMAIQLAVAMGWEPDRVLGSPDGGVYVHWGPKVYMVFGGDGEAVANDGRTIWPVRNLTTGVPLLRATQAPGSSLGCWKATHTVTGLDVYAIDLTAYGARQVVLDTTGMGMLGEFEPVPADGLVPVFAEETWRWVSPRDALNLRGPGFLGVADDRIRATRPEV